MKFNEWSRDRIRKGRKFITSRKKQHKDDPDVSYIVGPLPWKFIRRFLWWDEGASCPDHLQSVIDEIFARRKRPVGDDEQFYIHVLSDSCLERYHKEVKS